LIGSGTDDDQKWIVGGLNIRLSRLVLGYSVYYNMKAEHDDKAEREIYWILNDSKKRMDVLGGGATWDRDGTREKFISYEGRVKDLNEFPFYIRGTVVFRPDNEVEPQITVGMCFLSSYCNDDK
jgi:hypothetical protein